MIRKVIAYKNNFVDFYKNQDSRIQEKIEYVLDSKKEIKLAERLKKDYLKEKYGGQ